ncbi:hypothetical protein PPSIR1_29083 [Plesiocystis pacifica SIR-1]|uniref:Uncharacterized protein n=1 Tax=Plesiocystis pacifica SIR-1 TaxID=391625 RepID=A6GHU8_9BACT|nr:hypothetical protein PPSIR1_29083 [Plesiocystis pacifica SIR-1]
MKTKTNTKAGNNPWVGNGGG